MEHRFLGWDLTAQVIGCSSMDLPIENDPSGPSPQHKGSLFLLFHHSCFLEDVLGCVAESNLEGKKKSPHQKSRREHTWAKKIYAPRALENNNAL